MDMISSLQEHIKEQAAQRKDHIFAVFDFDNTCIVNDIGEATLMYLCRNKLLRDPSLLGPIDGSDDYHERVFHTYHDLYEQGKIKEAYMLNARMFSGFTTEEAHAATMAAIDTEGDVIGKTDLHGHSVAHGLAINPKTIALLDFVKTIGMDMWIVSASTEVAVAAAMEHFGIQAKLIGVRGVLEDGRFTKELESPMPIIEGKVACVRKYISEDSSPLMAVDDSMTGIALLETAAIKVIVDRGNALAKEARDRGWFIL